MMSMNKVMLLGHAGRNPEMRKLPSGDDVAQFSLATTERFRRKDDTVGESTEWHSVVAFGGAAEAVRKFVRKGDPVLVEGRIATRSWTDKKGVERRTTEIVVSGARGQINVLAKRRKDGDGGDDPPGGTAARADDGVAQGASADASGGIAGQDAAAAEAAPADAATADAAATDTGGGASAAPPDPADSAADAAGETGAQAKGDTGNTGASAGGGGDSSGESATEAGGASGRADDHA